MKRRGLERRGRGGRDGKRMGRGEQESKKERRRGKGAEEVKEWCGERLGGRRDGIGKGWEDGKARGGG